MAVTPTNGYCDEARIKAALNISDAADDTDLTAAIDAASRLIERWCRQRFWVDPSDVVRYYTATSCDSLALYGTHPHDVGVAAVTTVEVDLNGDGTYSQTYTEGTDWVATPRSAATNSQPYTRLDRLTGGRSWPVGIEEGVKVTGTFGWPAVPAEVTEACVIQASRLFKQVREAPFGIASVSFDGGGIRLLSKLDPNAEMLLAPFRRTVGFV